MRFVYFCLLPFFVGIGVSVLLCSRKTLQRVKSRNVKTNKNEMQMKRIFPLLAIELLLASCQTPSTNNVAITEYDDEAWLPMENLEKVPLLPARVDNTLRNICPAHRISNGDTIPPLAGEVTLLPLASTPDFHIGKIEEIYTDDDLLFILGAETKGEELFTPEIKERAGFIFRKNGKLVAQLKPTDVDKDKNKIVMAVNRQAKEVCLMFYDDATDEGDLLSYDYEGNLLRHELVFFNYGNIMGYTQNHLISNLRPAFDFAPQLTVRDPEGMPHGFILTRPNKVFTNDYEATLSNCGDELFYTTEYSDTIWQVSPEGAVARYFVSGDSVGIGSLPFNNDSTITKTQRELATENRFIPNIEHNLPLLVSTDFLLCRYIQKFNIKIDKETEEKFVRSWECLNPILVYDRKTGKSCWTWSHLRKWTMQGLCLSEAKALTTDGTLISCHTPAQLKYYVAHTREYELDSKTQKFIKKLDIKANPVLLLMPLKHF